MKNLLITLLLISPFSFAEKIALQCKSSNSDSYTIPIAINTETMTLKYHSHFDYTLNYVTDDYFHAYNLYPEGGAILVISRLNGKYWKGGVSTFCSDRTCSDSYKRTDSSTGDCRVAF